ncbi:unnamed protein product, partial [Tilletia laevis]
MAPRNSTSSSSQGSSSQNSAHAHAAESSHATIEPVISAPGSYVLQDVIAGCKIFVQRPDPDTGD